jgi:hypothetical protein
VVEPQLRKHGLPIQLNKGVVDRQHIMPASAVSDLRFTCYLGVGWLVELQALLCDQIAAMASCTMVLHVGH